MGHRPGGLLDDRRGDAAVQGVGGALGAETDDAVALADGLFPVLDPPDEHRVVQHLPALVRDLPAAVFHEVLRDQPDRRELPEDRAPFAVLAVGPDAEGRQLVVLEAGDVLRAVAAHDGHEVLQPEPLAGAHDGRHGLLRVNGGVVALDALEAEVAVAARLRALAEIGEQRLAAAARRLGQGDQGVEALALDALALLRSVALLDLHAAQTHVVQPVERQRVAGQAVALNSTTFTALALPRAVTATRVPPRAEWANAVIFE